jgi:O-antigen/teichoic acid export membrane protein
LIIIGLTQLNQFILDVIRLHFKPILFLLLSLLTRVLGLGLGIYFLMKNKSGLDDFYAAQAIILLITVPLGLWIIRKDFQIISIDLKVIKKLLKFGYPFIFVGLAYWLFGMIDRWMLAFMTTTENVGLFSIAYRFSSILFFVSTAFGQAWSPVSMKIMRDYPNNYRKIYGDVLIVLICILLFFAMILALFSGEIISLIMPLKYNQSAGPLIVLSFAILTQATLQITAIGISIEKKTHLFVQLTWIAALINLTLNFILIKSLGLIGSAYATLISNFFLTVSYFYFTQKLHPIILSKNKLLKLVLIAISCMILSLLMVKSKFILNIMIIKITLISILLFITASALPFNFIKVLNKK